MSIGHGSLIAVGTGMVLGAHISPVAKSAIQSADIVFCLVDGLAEKWLQTLTPNLVSLQPHYAVGKKRTQSYRDMVETVLVAVRSGRNVCLAAYGHPGIYACVPHWAVEAARAEGFDARMEPGISAEACLYADLGFDPGTMGCQSFDATHYLIYRCKIDPAACLILWQVGLAGEISLTRFETERERLCLLVEKLIDAGYPPEHEVILYEAAMIAICSARIERLPLHALPDASLAAITTLVLPPARPLEQDRAFYDRLKSLSVPQG